MDKVKKLGIYVREQRKLQKKSVREVSEATGIHAGAIIKFELGKTDMTISRVFKVFEYLDLSFTFLDIANKDSLKDYVLKSEVLSDLVGIIGKYKL